MHRINRYNSTWLIGLGIFFFLSYGAVNHLTAYIDSYKPVASFYFEWEHHLPFIPLFIVPYMSMDFLYALAFFIVPRYSYEKYKAVIHGLGLQLLFNQVFTLVSFLSFPLKYSFDKPEIPEAYQSIFAALLSFDLPYNQSPSLHISLTVIFMVFYGQHVHDKWLRYITQLWFATIGLSVIFTYQHHFIDIIMGLFAGLCSVVLFNHPLEHNPNFHLNFKAFKGRLFALFSIFLAIGTVLIFLLPMLGHLGVIDYYISPSFHIVLWFIYVSYLAMYKIKFWGHAFKIRNIDNRFRKSFYILAYPYLLLRYCFIKPFDYYPHNIEVTPSLFIGNMLSMRKEKSPGIFFNLAWEIDNRQSSTVSYPMLDLLAPNHAQIKTITKHMQEEIHNGNKVYVHCALGIFRTIYVTGSYLVLYEGVKPDEVIDRFLALPLHPKMKRYLERKKAKFTALYQAISP